MKSWSSVVGTARIKQTASSSKLKIVAKLVFIKRMSASFRMQIYSCLREHLDKTQKQVKLFSLARRTFIATMRRKEDLRQSERLND